MNKNKSTVPFSALSKKAMVAVMAFSLTATGVAGVTSSPIKAEASYDNPVLTVSFTNDGLNYQATASNRGVTVTQNGQLFKFAESYEPLHEIMDYDVYDNTLYLEVSYFAQNGTLGRKTMTVDMRDTVAPANPTITLVSSNPTTGEDTVRVDFSSDTDRYDIYSVSDRGEGGNLEYGHESFTTTLVEGELLTITAYDKAGNTSQEVKYVNDVPVSVTAPVLNVDNFTSLVKNSGTFGVSATGKQGETVVVKYRVDGLEGQSGTIAKTFTATGSLQYFTLLPFTATNLSEGTHTLSVWAETTNGAKSSEIHKSFKVDRTAPLQADVTLQYAVGVANVTIKKPTTNNDEYVSWEFEGADGSYDESGNYDQAVGQFTFKVDGVLRVKSYDGADNSVSKEYKISIPDALPPVKPTITPSTTASTGKVTVSIDYSTDSAVREVRVNYGAWMPYTQAIEVTKNYTVIEARAKNEKGMVSDVASYRVTNIDNIAPTLSLRPSTTAKNQSVVYVVATVSDSGSGIDVTKYAVGNQTASYFKTNGTVFYDRNFAVTANGVYTVYAKDKAGNETVRTITITNTNKAVMTKSTGEVVIVDLAVASATSAVESAEKYKSAFYVSNAKVKVQALPASAEKTDLLNRLAKLENTLLVASAEKAVLNAEKYKSSYYVSLATKEVAKLQAGTVKTSLQNRLNVVSTNLLVADAQKAVDYWKKYKSSYYFKIAVTKVNALPEGTVKTQLKTVLGI